MPYHYVEEVFPKSIAVLEESDEEFVDWLRVLGGGGGTRICVLLRNFS